MAGLKSFFIVTLSANEVRRRSALFRRGKINRDQVHGYTRRKGMDVKAVERWLAPNLGYDIDEN
ncbi:MAG: hypothetical protein ACREXR_06000 [Gammaproteobacteria bacterium]